MYNRVSFPLAEASQQGIDGTVIIKIFGITIQRSIRTGCVAGIQAKITGYQIHIAIAIQIGNRQAEPQAVAFFQSKLASYVL